MSNNLDSLLPQINQLRSKHQSIVLATGVFDLLHQEHKNFLHKAKQAGDVLIVGLESDHRVRQIKGPNRPINNQTTRHHNLLKLPQVDLAFILPEQFSKPKDHQQLISTLKPNILAVSSHSPHLDKKQQILKQYGGNVKIVHQHNPKVSTSKIINQLNPHENHQEKHQEKHL